jgi:hypothetical protein
MACGTKPAATRAVTAVPPDEPRLPTFNVRTIGPEPSGATPLGERDLTRDRLFVSTYVPDQVVQAE